MKAFSLIELLVSLAIISILASLLLPPTVRAFKSARYSIKNSQLRHEVRILGFLEDGTPPSQLLYLTTNTSRYSTAVLDAAP